jgi:hypothetical protein
MPGADDRQHEHPITNGLARIWTSALRSGEASDDRDPFVNLPAVPDGIRGLLSTRSFRPDGSWGLAGQWNAQPDVAHPRGGQ